VWVRIGAITALEDAMGDKNPKNTAKTNKQKARDKALKPAQTPEAKK
jgi:hypothetical protein